MITLPCSKCGKNLPLDSFYSSSPQNTNRGGRSSNCKDCIRKATKKRQSVNPEKLSEWSRKYLYGVTQEQYDDLRENQDYCCAICGIDEDDLVSVSKSVLNLKLHVDHDHATGKVRGLLCFRCNHGLGKFQDSIDVLEKALAYLREHTNEPNF